MKEDNILIIYDIIKKLIKDYKYQKTHLNNEYTISGILNKQECDDIDKFIKDLEILKAKIIELNNN